MPLILTPAGLMLKEDWEALELKRTKALNDKLKRSERFKIRMALERAEAALAGCIVGEAPPHVEAGSADLLVRQRDALSVVTA